MRCVGKLRVFQALGKLQGQEMRGGIAEAIAAHSYWLGGIETEMSYRKG